MICYNIDSFRESAMNLPWIYHESDRKVPGNFYDYVNLFISDNSWRLRESAMNLPWKRHESAMNLPWWNQYEYDIDHFEALEKLPGICHEADRKVPGNFYEYVNLFISDNSWRLRESAMNLPWKRHESAMNLPWWNQYEYDIDHFEALEKVPWICHESDRKVPGNFYEYVNLFISDNSLRLRESAMNLPWKRHESAMNLPWWNQYEYDIDHLKL